ncbi:hypothetical protein UT300003_24710 [Clostridium sardiniense]
MDKEIIRIKITEFLQWNYKDDYYTDENNNLEDIPRRFMKIQLNISLV